jgi:hypothetical protein
MLPHVRFWAARFVARHAIDERIPVALPLLFLRLPVLRLPLYPQSPKDRLPSQYSQPSNIIYDREFRGSGNHVSYASGYK